jgi:hypothetical protein
LIQRIADLIHKFLDEPRESEGGYALVTDDDMTLLSEIVQELIVRKCERDPDGDLPIEFALINRREKHFAIDPWINALPYRDDSDTPSDPLERGGRLEKLMYIVKEATNKLSCELDVVQYNNTLYSDPK